MRHWCTACNRYASGRLLIRCKKYGVRLVHKRFFFQCGSCGKSHFLHEGYYPKR